MGSACVVEHPTPAPARDVFDVPDLGGLVWMSLLDEQVAGRRDHCFKKTTCPRPQAPLAAVLIFDREFAAWERDRVHARRIDTPPLLDKSRSEDQRSCYGRPRGHTHEPPLR